MLLVFVAGAGAVVHEPARPPAAPTTDPWIDVMTYNVHQYWSSAQTGRHNLEALRDTIRDANPDIAGLQESEGGRVTSGSLDGVRWLAHTLGYHSAPGPPARESIYGIAILSKWPITDTEWVYLPNQDGVERGVLIANVDHPDGAVNVAVTHFDTREHVQERTRQAQGLLRILEQRGPLVLMGDFNAPASSDNEAYTTIASSFTDAWLVAGLPSDGGITELARGPDSARVDLIWLRGDWLVDTCSLHGGPEASDHRALGCRIQSGTG